MKGKRRKRRKRRERNLFFSESGYREGIVTRTTLDSRDSA